MTDMTDAELREARTALADLVERFARTEIAPHVTEWDAAGEFPRALYRRAAELGLLGMGYPEEFGGTPAPAMLATLIAYAVSAAGCAYEIPVGRNTSVLSPNPVASGSRVTGTGPEGPTIVTVAFAKSAPGKDSDQRFDIDGRFWYGT